MPDRTFSKARFLKSAFTPKDILTDRPSILFLGRSNVGKSTLINSLCRNKTLMKASKTPGRTKMINYALVDEAFYLCDAPGYGFASFEREHFGSLMDAFLQDNGFLAKVYLLVDARRLLLPADEEFLKYLVDNGIPCSIVFTKVDKLGKGDRHFLNLEKEKVGVSVFEVSSTDTEAIERLRKDILAVVREKIAGRKAK